MAFPRMVRSRNHSACRLNRDSYPAYFNLIGVSKEICHFQLHSNNWEMKCKLPRKWHDIICGAYNVCFMKFHKFFCASFFNVLDACRLLFNLCYSRFANFATKKPFLTWFRPCRCCFHSRFGGCWFGGRPLGCWGCWSPRSSRTSWSPRAT